MNIEEIRYSQGEILAIKEDGILAKNAKGEYCTIPLPKFRHKQFVKTTDTYFSPKSFTRLVSPCYTETRGWVYGENYVDRTGMFGGTGWSFDEDGFLPLTDARDILIAKRIEIKEELSELTHKTKLLNDELAKVEYAIQLTQQTTQ